MNTFYNVNDNGQWYGQYFVLSPDYDYAIEGVFALTKKKASLSVDADLSDLFIGKVSANRSWDSGLSIKQAHAIVIKQMTAIGLSPRTISNYELIVTHYDKVTVLQSITCVSEGSVHYIGLTSVNMGQGEAGASQVLMRFLRAMYGKRMACWALVAQDSD